MKTNRVLSLTLAILCCCFLTEISAQDFVVFRNDFNADTVGQQPSLNPFGDPEGDEMWFYSLSNGATALVEDALYGLTDKPMVASRPSGSYFQLYFMLDPTHTDCRAYTVNFDAMAGNHLKEGFVYFRLNEVGYRGFAAVAFADDPLSEVFSQGPITLWSSADETSVRWYEGMPLNFRIEVDIDDAHFSIFIDGAPVPEAQQHPFSVGNHNGTFGSMSLHFGGMQDAVMAVDNLEIVAHCGPGLPSESTSWGAVKAQWD